MKKLKEEQALVEALHANISGKNESTPNMQAARRKRLRMGAHILPAMLAAVSLSTMVLADGGVAGSDLAGRLGLISSQISRIMASAAVVGLIGVSLISLVCVCVGKCTVKKAVSRIFQAFFGLVIVLKAPQIIDCIARIAALIQPVC